MLLFKGCHVHSLCLQSDEIQPASSSQGTLPLDLFYESFTPQLNMAGFLRGKQAGIQNDLSSGILPGLFAPDDQARYGINSQIGYV
jgi:hypothetical protein